MTSVSILRLGELYRRGNERDMLMSALQFAVTAERPLQPCMAFLPARTARAHSASAGQARNEDPEHGRRDLSWCACSEVADKSSVMCRVSAGVRIGKRASDNGRSDACWPRPAADQPEQAIDVGLCHRAAQLATKAGGVCVLLCSYCLHWSRLQTNAAVSDWLAL